jgi:putative transposase
MPDQFRRPNRLPPAAYMGRRSYLVTICLKNRRRLFTNPAMVHRLIALLGQETSLHFFTVYAYCFMPDHCHLLLTGRSPNCDLSKLISSFKGNAAAVLRDSGRHDVWQKSFHDHVIRDADGFRKAAAYIWENPLRAGLVENAHDWPFSGSLVIDWRPTATQTNITL